MYKSELKYYKKAFLTAAIIGVILLLPFVIIDGGYFIYYGDYNAQQIPFYYHCNQMIKSGSVMWDWNTDLGANFIGSYSFYTLGSPFFWLTVPFPAEFSKYLMAPLMVLKLACCSLFAFAYIRRFVTKPNAAIIGGLLYAFSGFSMYNVFFNHFHEAMVVFPLMLIALEEAVINKRRLFFALTVALNAFVNYFFFAGECIFLVVYFLCRLTDSRFKIDVRTFLALAFESIIGVMLAGAMFVPAIIAAMDVPRSSNPLVGWNMVFHNPSQRYGIIFHSLFFPCDIPARQNFFPDSSARWSSVSAYLPLFSMAGVISFIKYKKKHWAKLLLPICLLIALIPMFNSAFVMFNSSYYTRWFYMPILVSCYITAYVIEHKEIDIRYGIKWCALGVGLISLVGILPAKVKQSVVDSATGESVESEVIELFTLPKEKLPFWLSVIFAITGLVVLSILFKNRKKLSVNAFVNKAFVFTLVACIGFSYYTLIYGRAIGPAVGDYNSIVDAEIDFDKYGDNEGFYRIETFGVTNNANMLWDKYGFRSFQSILPGSTFEYYKDMDFKRSVNTDPKGDYYAMRSLNSTKYLVIQSRKVNNKDSKELLENMRSFEKVGEQDGFTIYKNKSFIPMGYSYDYYMSYENYMDTAAANRDNVLIKATALSPEQVEKYSDLMTELPIEMGTNFQYSQFEKDCAALSKNCVDSFEPVANGFVAKSSYDNERFVVFTVPYESGWSAKVNGETVEVEKVNGGVMGVKVPAGEAEIVFSYVTPGLKIGIVFTVVAAGLLVVYYIILKKFLRYKPMTNRHLYENDQLDSIINHDAYIAMVSKVKSKKSSDNSKKKNKAAKNSNKKADSDNNEQSDLATEEKADNNSANTDTDVKEETTDENERKE